MDALARPWVTLDRIHEQTTATGVGRQIATGAARLRRRRRDVAGRVQRRDGTGSGRRRCRAETDDDRRRRRRRGHDPGRGHRERDPLFPRRRLRHRLGGSFGAVGDRTGPANGAKAITVDYRLAPEHPYPAAVEDARAAYEGLLGQGVDAGQIALAGESAGAGWRWPRSSRCETPACRCPAVPS